MLGQISGPCEKIDGTSKYLAARPKMCIRCLFCIKSFLSLILISLAVYPPVNEINSRPSKSIKMKFFIFLALIAVATAAKCHGTRTDGCEECEANEISCSKCPSGKYLRVDKTCDTTCTAPADKMFEGQCYVNCPHGAPSDKPKECNKSFGGYLASGVAVLIAVFTLL